MEGVPQSIKLKKSNNNSAEGTTLDFKIILVKVFSLRFRRKLYEKNICITI